MEKEIVVNKRETCSECRGSGSEPGTSPEQCPACRGTGQVARSQGFFTLTSTCPQCRGEGSYITHPCPECRGRGLTHVRKKVLVRIPPGVDTGSRLRLTGEGEGAPHGGLPGDLYVFIRVEPHEFFRRDDTDVVCQIPISFVQAALGDSVEVPTLHGTRELEIPKGAQPGDVFRFENEGIPSLRSGEKGDQIVQVLVRTPTGLTKKQVGLLREFARLEERKLSTKLKKILKGETAR
ncbi:DnaJ C-terminal domain-containing protein [Thermodesulfobacteriota bacterium]